MDKKVYKKKKYKKATEKHRVHIYFHNFTSS